MVGEIMEKELVDLGLISKNDILTKTSMPDVRINYKNLSNEKKKLGFARIILEGILIIFLY